MNTRCYILSIIAALLLGACSKTEYGQGDAHGGLSFYNASYTLDAFLGGANNAKVLLPLTPGSKQPAPLTSGTTPVFSNCSNCGNRYEFPAINTANAVPWMVFDYYTPGTYTAGVHLNNIDSATQLSFPVTIAQDQHYTYALSDSLGTYHVTAVTHAAEAPAGKVRLRLLQLCPDADSVNLRIGNNLLAGMQNLAYQDVSGAVDYPLAADSTLKLRIFNAGDTLTTIARADLAATPGQSYLLILRNYRQPHQYTNKDGNTVNIIANGILDLRKIE